MARHHTDEPRQDVHDAYQQRYQAEIAQMVWAHWSVKHSHYKNPRRQGVHPVAVADPDYWAWTRSVDPEDYLFDGAPATAP